MSTKGLNVESSKETEALLLELGWQEKEKLENLNQRIAEQWKKNRDYAFPSFERFSGVIFRL